MIEELLNKIQIVRNIWGIEGENLVIAITDSIKTGTIDVGRIFVITFEKLITIRTGETNKNNFFRITLEEKLQILHNSAL